MGVSDHYRPLAKISRWALEIPGAKTRLLRLIFPTTYLLQVSAWSDRLDAETEIEKINRMINMLKKELNSNDVDKINHLIDQLNESTKQFAEKRIDKSFSSLVGEEIGGV